MDNNEKSVSLGVAIGAVVLTLGIVIGVGIFVGNKFFWNQFEPSSVAAMQYERTKAAYEEDPENRVYIMAYAYQRLVSGEVEEALKMYNELYEEDPKDEIVNFNIGIAYVHLGEYEKSIDYLRVAVEKNPVHYLGRVNLGIALHETGSYEEALKMFDEALVIKKAAADVLYLKAKTLDAMGKKEEALKTVNQAISYVPDYKEAVELKNKLSN